MPSRSSSHPTHRCLDCLRRYLVGIAERLDREGDQIASAGSPPLFAFKFEETLVGTVGHGSIVSQLWGRSNAQDGRGTMRSAPFVVLLVLAFAQPAHAQQVDQQTRQQVESTVAQYIDALNKGDGQACLALI